MGGARLPILGATQSSARKDEPEGGSRALLTVWRTIRGEWGLT